MRNYLSLGPVRIKVSRRGIAKWGYAKFIIGGLELFSRSSNGDLNLCSYHPRRSATWHWAVYLTRRVEDRRIVDRAKSRSGQWHDYYRLPFGRSLIVSHQDYHKRAAP